MADLTKLRPRPRGITIAGLMAVSLVVALLASGFRLDLFRMGWELGVLVVVTTSVVARIVLLIYFEKQCPVCGKNGVARVAARSFGDRYYRCADCGARMKRRGIGRAFDASGPEDAVYFNPRRPVETWQETNEPLLDDPAVQTVLSLSKTKAMRKETEPGASVPPDRRSNRHLVASKAVRSAKSPNSQRFFDTLATIRESRD